MSEPTTTQEDEPMIPPRARRCLPVLLPLPLPHRGLPRPMRGLNRGLQVLAAAAAAQITSAFLPFRAPELMPCEDLWRQTKAMVATNRVYDTVQDLAERAVAWLLTLTPRDRLRRSAVLSSQFQRLST